MKNDQKPRPPEWTIIKLLKWATSYFRSHDIESPRASAEILLAHALNLQRIDLYLRYDQPLDGDELNGFKVLLKRRVKREPVAYIVGQKGFWSIDLKVTGDVLIPRPETECLVEKALDALSGTSTAAGQRVLELGTGSGAVILALAFQQPDPVYFASDASLNAIGIARANAGRLHLEEHIRFFGGDWFAALDPESGCFDLILSNPPYIKSAEMENLQPEILNYEPVHALDGGPDGLSSLRRIIEHAHQYLKPGGMLMVEIGHDQQADVHRIMQQCGHYDRFTCTQDYSGLDRVVQMRKKMLRMKA
jgi:release factor glutamine methyltransferase